MKGGQIGSLEVEVHIVGPLSFFRAGNVSRKVEVQVGVVVDGLEGDAAVVYPAGCSDAGVVIVVEIELRNVDRIDVQIALFFDRGGESVQGGVAGELAQFVVLEEAAQVEVAGVKESVHREVFRTVALAQQVDIHLADVRGQGPVGHEVGEESVHKACEVEGGAGSQLAYRAALDRLLRHALRNLLYACRVEVAV